MFKSLLTLVFALLFSTSALCKMDFVPFDFNKDLDNMIPLSDSDDENKQELIDKMTAWLKKKNVSISDPAAVTKAIIKGSDANGDGDIDHEEVKGFLANIGIGNGFTRGAWANGLIEAVMGFKARSITKKKLYAYVEANLDTDVRQLQRFNSQRLAEVDMIGNENNSINSFARVIPEFNSDSFNLPYTRETNGIGRTRQY